ncbi:MAG TPA: extensin family protein [Bradyrhizobium sp.]|nr:extensin family protein [Bradyrhizobium sp.]
MTRGVRLYLVGSLVLVSLAGCGRGFFQTEERAPWRAEAEIACLKSGAVKEGPGIVQIDPISGPGVCGAEFPLRVSELDEDNGHFGFADDDLRPPAPIGNQPRWPISQPPPSRPQASPYPAATYQSQPYPAQTYQSPPPYPGNAARPAPYNAPSNGPVSLTAPGIAPQEDKIALPPDGEPGEGASRQPYPPSSAYPSRQGYAAPYSPVPQQDPPRLGPSDPNMMAASGPVAVKPTATLACPIVSVLDRWLADSVQPAAMRWFGARVVEIKQISAYSCRGMNGNPNAHISEHAFGNALDIAAFILADGRKISVQDGWKGLPEEQGFLRDVQAAACRDFTTVLAPGANVYHYNHIHVDLMRRAHRPIICEPAPVSGEEVAARAARRNPYASREPTITGSLGSKLAQRKRAADDEDDLDDQ